MTGTNASIFTPLLVGQSDSGDFSSWLGRPCQVEEETFVMVQANVAIASGSNGKQLATALSSGQASFVVILSTGDASRYLTVGAIPWTHTGPIVSGAYFLALRDSRQHILLTLGATSGVTAGDQLMTSTGAALINIFSGALSTAFTGAASTSSGLGTLFDKVSAFAAVSLETPTGTTAASGYVRYHAPFKGAD